MTMRTMIWAVAAMLLLDAPTVALAQPNCRNNGSFEPWLANFKREAAAKGISQAAIAAASPYMVYDQRIVNIDRGQRFFAQNFVEMSDKMILGAGRLSSGAAQIKKHQALFAREEKEYGEPASVITAFWGLESDFGAGQGKDQAIKSLTTLAFDCRRSDMFRGHLFDALRLIERGDLRADEMIGSWAARPGNISSISAGSAASPGCRRCGYRRISRGRRPTSRSSIRARNGSAGASPAPTARRCRPTACRPRSCCRSAGSVRRSSPTTISRPI